ncbi:hypothetical protein Hanom_Chr00s029268g01768901 [Helianthus anomalus]
MTQCCFVIPHIFKFIGKDLSYAQVTIGTLIFHGCGYSRRSSTSISTLGISFLLPSLRLSVVLF